MGNGRRVAGGVVGAWMALVAFSCHQPAQAPMLGAGDSDSTPAQPDSGSDSAVSSPSDGSKTEPDGAEDARFFLALPDPLAPLSRGAQLRARLCQKKLADPVAELFCQDSPPQPTSMVELLGALGIEPSLMSNVQGFTLTAHSTALSKRFVSAINPRIVYARREDGDAMPLSVAFTRGEPFVEAVALDRTRRTLEFYVIAFTLPCHSEEKGCGPADLLTPNTEEGWLGVDVFHEDELDNTTLDCKVCHQPSGPSTAKLPRMQELENTWTHWLFNHTEGGRLLTEDFLAAHEGSAFGGLSADLLSGSRPPHLGDFARDLGPFIQPNMFNSGRIESDIEHSGDGQPGDNTNPGQSMAWRAIFEAAQRGEAIPVPYHNVKITDASKLAAMTTLYKAYRDGTLPAAQLPDIRDVFPDDPARLVEMGFLVDDQLQGQALLTAACAMCHNSRLDQSLTRAKFHTDLATLTRTQKDTAIRRLQLPSHMLGTMPPRRIHDLTDTTRARLIQLLEE